MLLVLVIGAGLGWKVDRARTQKRAVARIEAAGGSVIYDHTFNGEYPYKPNGSPWGPAWLRRRIGDEYFQEVTAVCFYKDMATDELLAAVEDLDRLLAFELWETKKVTDAGLAHLKSLQSLRVVRLHAAPITDAGLVHLESLPNLRQLSLGGKGITDASLGHLVKMTGIRDLTVINSGITDSGMAHLKSLTRLRKLTLANAHTTDAGLAHLAGLGQLEELNLSGIIDLTDAGLVWLKGLKNLRKLDLSGTMVTNEGLVQLSGLTGLQELDLSFDEITNSGLAQLSGLTGLRELNLYKTWVTDAGLDHLKGLRGLRVLRLNRAFFSDEAIDRLAAAIPGLDVTKRNTFYLGPTPARPRRALRKQMAETKIYHQTLKEYQQTLDEPGPHPLPPPPSFLIP
jgi:hypothetical protein